MSDPIRVLIVGGGFGGIYAALDLEKALGRISGLEVTLVTRDNFFLFTPMLHEVAASDLDCTNIVSPLRTLVRRVNVFVGTVEGIDLAARRVTVSHGFEPHRHDLPYDHLVLALGVTTNFFALPGVAECAITMKTLDDAMALRSRLIGHLEEADTECAAGVRQPLLTVVVAGAGFAGVETIAGVNDFLHEALRHYPNLRAEHLRVVLVTPDDVILPELSPKLGRYAARKLADRGVEIAARCRVARAEGGVVTLTDGRTIPASTLVWTAGTAPNPLVASLPLQKTRGRLVVDEFLAVPGASGVWAVGDCALVPDGRGGYHPPTAQHALRQGARVAANILATLHGRALRPFRFRTLGQLAAIGRRTGVASILGVNFSGFVAWWLWRTIYLSKLPRFEKKVRVALGWTLDLFFAKDITRYGGDSAADRREPARAPRAA